MLKQAFQQCQERVEAVARRKGIAHQKPGTTLTMGWVLGSAQKAEPMSLQFAQQSFAKAMDQGQPDQLHSLWLALGVAVFVVLLARSAAAAISAA